MANAIANVSGLNNQGSLIIYIDILKFRPFNEKVLFTGVVITVNEPGHSIS